MIFWYEQSRRLRLGLLLIVFLMTGLLFAAQTPVVRVEAAFLPPSTTSQVLADTPFPVATHQPDTEPGVQRISFADEQKLHPHVSSEDGGASKTVVQTQFSRSADGSTASNGKATMTNVQPATQPNLNPHFANTYYANKTADDGGTDTAADCRSSANTACSLRSAIVNANGDAHGTNPSLILTKAATAYMLGSTALPTLGSYITLSNSSTQGCPSGLSNDSIIQVGSLPATADILTLSSNDVISGIEVDNSLRDGFVLTGSNNILTCSTAFSSAANGVNISGANNQIGQAGNGGTLGAADFTSVKNTTNGILISGTGASGNVVKNASIGFYPPISATYPNGTGVTISGGATNNRIGSDTNPQQYVNFIRNNNTYGVYMDGTGTSGNIVAGNYIGLAPSGSTIAANNSNEVYINTGANNTTIGGDRSAGFGNVVAGSPPGNSAVLVARNDGSIVQGNIIGLTVDFSSTLPVGANGIRLVTTTNAQVLGNIVGGSTTNGIELYAANNSTLYGNYIGTDPTATRTNLGNGNDGILVHNTSSNNQIGGAATGQANYIGGNAFSGINISDNGTNNNKVQGNIIGVKGDFSGPLSNGTSTGTRTGATVCTPGTGSGGTPDIQSEDCNGVFITATGGTAGPTGNLIGGDSRAGQGNLIAQTLGSDYPTGVLLDFAGSNTVQGNSIGARISGSTVTAYDTSVGIWLINGSSSNQIGGDSSVGQGNLTGKNTYGIVINEYKFGSGSVAGPANSNKIQGNAVGVNFTGNADPNLAINGYGIAVYNDSVTPNSINNNLIGVDFSASSPNLKQANLIGNTGTGGYGIYFSADMGGNANQLNGNYIGVKPDGSAGSGNQYGIYATLPATNTRIQGNYIGAANIPTTTTTYGMYISGGMVSSIITGNYVGTNAAGADLHNSIGVFINGGTIKTSLSQNTIGRNTTQGVQLDNTTTNQNTISQNSIFGNGGPGINLGYTAGNPNGIVGGNATGPNNQAAKPTLTAASINGTSLKVSGTANPGSNVEVFLGDSSGSTQGQTYLATVPSSALDSSGNFNNVTIAIASGVSFQPLNKLVATSTLLTPTAYAGSTSQFSDPLANVAATYSYYLPLLANNANTPVGQTTTYITFQNLSSSAPANITIQYYGLTSGTPTTSDSVVLPIKGQKAILPNVGAGNSGGGIITSDQPLNVVVSESVSSGGSAYNVTGQVAASLYSPLALNGAFGGFTTNIIIFNAGGAASTGTIQFYDESGTAAASQPFTINSHASQTLSQAALSGLSSNHSYWAKITGGASDSLTAQVIEFGPSNFVATFNASVPTQTAITQYAPAAFNGLYGYVTGMGFANPNSTAASVTVTYYDGNGNVLTSPAAISIPANGNGSLFQGLPGTAASVASASIVSTQPLVMTVNERGPNNAAGTYVGIAGGSTTVALPVMANGFAGFVTGTTIFNAGSGTATLTLTYLDASGNPTGTAQSQPSLAPNASFALYQGAGSQGLNSNFFGTALITSNQPLIVTTNALNTTTGLFYTYTEPSK